MQHDEQPILADVDHDRCVAGLSLPGFGPFLQHHKVRNAIVRLVADLAGIADAGLEHGRHHPIRLGRAAARFLQPVRVLRAGRGRHTRRYVTTPRRGRVRLLAGMVRTNQPWRLVLGMRTALAAVLGTSAYLTLTNTTIWLLATRLGAGKLVLTLLVAVALMVAWIIGAHHLWERARDEGEREETILYNASTVLTLSIGVAAHVRRGVRAHPARVAVLPRAVGTRLEPGPPAHARRPPRRSPGWPPAWPPSPVRWAPGSTARTPSAAPPTATASASAATRSVRTTRTRRTRRLLVLTDLEGVPAASLRGDRPSTLVVALLVLQLHVAVVVAADGLRGPLEGLAEEADRGRERSVGQHHEEGGRGDERPERRIDQPEDHRRADATEVADRAWDVDEHRPHLDLVGPGIRHFCLPGASWTGSEGPRRHGVSTTFSHPSAFSRNVR